MLPHENAGNMFFGIGLCWVAFIWGIAERYDAKWL